MKGPHGDEENVRVSITWEMAGSIFGRTEYCRNVCRIALSNLMDTCDGERSEKLKRTPNPGDIILLNYPVKPSIILPHISTFGDFYIVEQQR